MPVPEFGSSGFKDYARERCAKWLATRERDAASLIAMLDLTGDNALLDEAAERFPNDPRVCLAMIARLNDGGDPMPWVESLIAAEPGNPAGWYLKARALAKAKKPEEAIQALREATAIKGRPESHLRDRMVTVREAALASGASVREAASVAVMAPLSRIDPTPIAGSLRLLREQTDQAKAAGNLDKAAEIAALGAASAEHYALTHAPSTMDEIVRLSLLKSSLQNLEADTEYGTGGKTAGTRVQEVEAEIKSLNELVQRDSLMDDPHLTRLTDSQVARFSDEYILHGEMAARRWLATQVTVPAGKE